ncbi:MAG: hypothetical protein IT243_05095 [Bacteroidia bacterium]|nr:hypothetical protein [Bacteroidia bacterium]
MKINSLLLFLLIFGIGFGAGFIISGRITNKKISEVKHRQTPAGFKEEIYKYIKPKDNQKKYLDSVIAEYLPKLKKENEIRIEYQKKIRDSLFADIQSLLDKKQKSKFKKYEESIIKPEKKLSKKPLTDTMENEKGIRKKLEKFRETLTPDQQHKLDSIIAKRKHDLKNPQLKREIHIYTRLNIFPIIYKYRIEFENELSDEEKEIIAELIEKRKNYRKEFVQSQIEDSETEDMDEKMKLFNIESRNALLIIASKHKESLEKIAEELAPHRQQWEKDINEIKAKYIKNYKAPEKKPQKVKEKNIIDFLLINTKKNNKKNRNSR